MSGICDLCGKQFPGDHRQEIDRNPGEIDLVFWICPFVEEEA